MGAAAWYGYLRANEAQSNFKAAQALALDLLAYPVAPAAGASERLDVLNRVDLALSKLASHNALDRNLALSRLQIWQDLSRLETSRNNIPGAIQIVRKQIEYTQDLSRQYPGDGVVAALSASSLIALGDLQRVSDLAEATALYENSVSLLRASQPLDSQRERILALALERLGGLAIASGDMTEAQNDLASSLEMRRRTLEQSPADATLREDYSSALSNFAGLQIGAKDVAGALTSSLRALAIRRSLVEDQPADVDRKRNLAKLLCRLAMLGKLSGTADSEVAGWIEEGARHANDLTILDPRGPQNQTLISAFRALSEGEPSDSARSACSS